MQDIVAADLLFEVGVDHFQQVIGFTFSNCHFRRVAGVLAVRGADQGEVVQVRNCENDALIFVLQDMRVFTLVKFRHDHVAALNQANAIRRFHPQIVTDELGDPRAGCIHQRFGPNREQAAIGAFQVQVPQTLGATSADAAGLGVYVRAFFAGGHGVEHHQTRVINPAIGVFKTLSDFAFQRAVRAELQAFRTLQLLAFAEVVVQEQAGTDHPGRTQMRTVRQHKAHLLDDVRRLLQQHFALSQGFTHQAEFVMFEVAQATVDQLAAGRRSMTGQIVLFAKEHREAATGCVCCDSHAIDAATDHGDVVYLCERGRRQGKSWHRLASGFLDFLFGIRT